MPQFAFVECGDQGRVNKDDDWLVRSHCMLGKNKRSGGARHTKKQKEVRASSKRKAGKGRIPITTGSYNFVLHVPATLDTDPSIFLPISVDRKSWFMLRRFSRYLPELYPLDLYVDQAPFCDELHQKDEGALTTALMAASAHEDFISCAGLTNHTRQLISNTISHLNKLLNKDDIRSRNSAAHMILELTAVALLCGEYNAAYTHLNGMHEIFRLYRTQNARIQSSCDTGTSRINVLQMKIERLAFCLYNITGRNGPFFSKSPSWDPIHYGPYISERRVLTGSPKLDSIFYDLQGLCHVFAQTASIQGKVDAQYFHRVIHSLQARVLALPEGEGTPLQECLRLGITAALSTQTQMPMRRLEHPYLNNQFRRYLPLLRCPDNQEGKEVVFWIMIIAFVVALDPEEAWWAETLFRQVTDDAGTYEIAKQRLAGGINWFMGYIDVQGEKVFKKWRQMWPLQ